MARNATQQKKKSDAITDSNEYEGAHSRAHTLTTATLAVL